VDTQEQSTKILTLTGEKYLHGGLTLCREEGTTYLVEGLMPGEKARVEVSRKRKTWFGKTLEIIDSSSDRVEPLCSHFGVCGGCRLQFIPYELQLKWKAEAARENFQRLGNIPLDKLPIHGENAYGYRSRIQVQRDGSGKLGFMAAGSREVVTIENCPILVPQLNDLWTHPEKIPTEPGRYPLSASSDQVFYPGEKEPGTVKVLDKEIHFAPGGFFQSNIPVLELLLNRLQSLFPLSPENRQGMMLDLYGGAGLFSAFFGVGFDQVEVVDFASANLALAGENLRGLNWVSRSSDVEKYLRKSLKKKNFHPSLVLVDPPRTGLGSSVAQLLGNLESAHLVYVSCDIATQARDLKILLSAGYELQHLELFDFYPQTPHLESLAILKWGSSK
jgi:23S rRNA (uracil1939-C5)-methyltransferase